MYYVLINTPLAPVDLSKHYTTKTTTMNRSLSIQGNAILPTYLDQIRKLTVIIDLNLMIHWQKTRYLLSGISRYLLCAR